MTSGCRIIPVPIPPRMRMRTYGLIDVAVIRWKVAVIRWKRAYTIFNRR
jgi:hypothetical protein